MDVNAEDSAGATPLADAVRCGRREEQAALRGAGGRLGAADSAERLCLAAAANDLDTLNVRPRLCCTSASKGGLTGSRARCRSRQRPGCVVARLCLCLTSAVLKACLLALTGSLPRPPTTWRRLARA